MVEFTKEVKNKITKSKRLLRAANKDLVFIEKTIKKLKKQTNKALKFMDTIYAGKNIDKNFKVIIKDHNTISKLVTQIEKL